MYVRTNNITVVESSVAGFIDARKQWASFRHERKFAKFIDILRNITKFDIFFSL